jgi:ABC-2 type transport system permease protein
VIAFVLGVFIAFLFTAAGLPIVGDTLTGLLGQSAGRGMAIISILDQFDGLNRGVIEARALVFFTSFMAAWLGVATLLVDGKRRVGS